MRFGVILCALAAFVLLPALSGCRKQVRSTLPPGRRPHVAASEKDKIPPTPQAKRLLPTSRITRRPFVPPKPVAGTCVVCGKQTDHLIYLDEYTPKMGGVCSMACKEKFAKDPTPYLKNLPESVEGIKR